MLEAYPARWSPSRERYFRLELRAPKGPKTFFCAVSMPCLPGRSGQREETRFPRTRLSQLAPGFPPSTHPLPPYPAHPPAARARSSRKRWEVAWSHHPGPCHVCGSGGIFGAVITAARGHDVMCVPCHAEHVVQQVETVTRVAIVRPRFPRGCPI